MNRSASGRPVRFFALVMAGWVTIRLVSPDADPWGGPIDKPASHDPAHPKIWAAATQTIKLLDWRTFTPQVPAPAFMARPLPPSAGRSGKAMGVMAIPLPAISAAMTAPAAAARAADQEASSAPTPNPAPATPLASQPPASPDRWHGSAWLLWRDGSATRADAIAGGRLGGSQAGARVDFDLTPQASGRTSAYARASTALNRPASPEAALGIAWQPARTVPISFAAERRIALGKGARNANAVMAVGGFGPTPVAPSLEVEAYAQGGMVGFRSNDFFVDGKMSLLSPIKHSPLRIGASLSGGAQPQVERLDVGPELQIRLPLKPVGARLGIEWRQRIAGQAAPASGLAVTLGADF